MKKIIAAALCASTFVSAVACDVCGNVNHLNPYLFPHLSKSYFGLAYFQSRYRLSHDGSDLRQSVQTLLLTGQYSASAKLQLTAMLPYQWGSLASQTATASRAGIGDASLMANYRVFQKAGCKATHALGIGLGLKLATGRYNAAKAESFNASGFQLGSGSLDYLLNAAYRVKAGAFAFNLIGAYKYATPNKEGYRYGDVFTTGATAIYLVKKGEVSLMPYLQAVNEKHYNDADKHVLQAETGGSVLYAGGGLDVSKRKITVGINYGAAAHQNLMQGALQARPRFSTRISFTL